MQVSIFEYVIGLIIFWDLVFDMVSYAGNLIEELVTPMVMAVQEKLEGEGVLATVIFCESLLGPLQHL